MQAQVDEEEEKETEAGDTGRELGVWNCEAGCCWVRRHWDLLQFKLTQQTCLLSPEGFPDSCQVKSQHRFWKGKKEREFLCHPTMFLEGQ